MHEDKQAFACAKDAFEPLLIAISDGRYAPKDLVPVRPPVNTDAILDPSQTILWNRDHAALWNQHRQQEIQANADAVRQADEKFHDALRQAIDKAFRNAGIHPNTTQIMAIHQLTYGSGIPMNSQNRATAAYFVRGACETVIAVLQAADAPPPVVASEALIRYVAVRDEARGGDHVIVVRTALDDWNLKRQMANCLADWMNEHPGTVDPSNGLTLGDLDLHVEPSYMSRYGFQICPCDDTDAITLDGELLPPENI